MQNKTNHPKSSKYQAYKRFLNPMLFFIVLAGILYANNEIFPVLNSFAQGTLHLPDPTKLGENLPTPKGDSTLEQVKTIVASLARNVKYLVGALAIAAIMYSGFRMVIGHGDENAYTEQGKSLTWIVVGLVIVGAAGFIGEFLDISDGGILKSNQIILTKAKYFDSRIQIIMTFIKYLLGSLAVGMIIISGFKLITKADEETLGEEKKKIAAYSFAFIILLIANTLVNKVFFVVDKSAVPSGSVTPIINFTKGMAEIKGITNFLLMFIAPISILVMMVGAVMYVISGADEELRNKAKAILKNSAIAMAIIFAVYAIVATFIQGQVSF